MGEWMDVEEGRKEMSFFEEVVYMKSTCVRKLKENE